MPTVWADFSVLGATLAAGLGIGLLHDLWLILVLGQPLRPGGRGQAAQVVPGRLWGFWLLSVALAWSVLAVYAAGQVRGFVFIGFAAGAGLYYLAFSPGVRRVIAGLRQAFVRAVRALLDGLTWLVLLPWRVLTWAGRPVIAVATAVLGIPAGWFLGGIDWSIRLAGRCATWIQRVSPRRRPPVEP